MRNLQFLRVLIVFVLIVAACGGDSDDTPEASADASSTGEVESEPTVEAEADPTAEPDPEPETEAEPEPDPEPTEEPEAEPEPAAPAAVRLPTEVTEPGDAGNGIEAPLASSPLIMPEEYSEIEYIFGGEATSYVALGELTEDGFWDSQENDTAAYRTRMIVRTPPAEKFSGTVLVEWFNVTAGHDTSPDWGFLHEEIGRRGHAYVGVSVQSVGLNGRDGDFIEGGLVNTSGLILIDPERYGDLEHPGDAYAYDIFTQAGALVASDQGPALLGGLEPQHIIGMGESQSAIFMTTYVNAIHPLVDTYDGFLIHSRGGTAPDPSGERSSDVDVRMRTDLDDPVFLYVTETDLTRLAYFPARQDDSETVMTWEVAGTAHADAYSLFSSGLPGRDANMGGLLGCETPINDGPQHETLQAALSHLVAWVALDRRPPESPLISMIDAETFERDELGVVVGGIRTPVVDAPLRVLSGAVGPDGGACTLFGQTLTFDDGVLTDLYADQAAWEAAFNESLEVAVRSGWLLPPDAESMLAEETERATELLGAL